MTAPIPFPPAILTDSSGNRWVYAGMTDLGPAYAPQQATMPLPEAKLADMPWADAVLISEAMEGE